MRHEAITTRQRVNLLLDRETVGEARELGINLSQVAARALAAEVKKERDRRWQEDNKEWVEAHNRWVEQHGLPLERYRLF